MSDKEKADMLARDETSVSFSVAYKQLYPFSSLCSVGEKMAEWKQQQMMEKAVNWLKENADKYVGRALEEYDMQYYGCISIDEFIEDFKQAMGE